MKSISISKDFAVLAATFGLASILTTATPSWANESWAVAYMGSSVTGGDDASTSSGKGLGQGPSFSSQIDSGQKGYSQTGSGQTRDYGQSGQLISPHETNGMSTQAPEAVPTLPPLGAVQPQDYRVAPYAGHGVQAQRPATFRWGWFGAEHFYPQVRWHENYKGELVRWSSQRRY